MDRGQEFDQHSSSSPTKSLRIHKQPSPVRLSRPQPPSDSDNIKQPKHLSRQRYPPRTSSLLRDNESGVSRKYRSREKDSDHQKNDNSSTGRSMPPNSAYNNNSVPHPSIGDSNAQSTVSSLKERYLSGSTEIIGDFVPVNADMAFPSREMEHHPDLSCAVSHPGGDGRFNNPYVVEPGTPYVVKDTRQFTRVINPYEFEHSTPYGMNNNRQTTFSDFMGYDDASTTTRAPHVKNALSEDNAMYMIRKPAPLQDPQPKSNSHQGYHRSESSPRLNRCQSPQRRIRTPSPEFTSYYGEDESARSHHRGRSRSRSVVDPDRRYENRHIVRTPDQFIPNGSTTQDFRTPSRMLSPSHVHGPQPDLSSPSRTLTMSPIRVLADVSEREEGDSKMSYLGGVIDPIPSTPKKRSRSPMKRMFGEHGWLGRSPDELNAVKLKSEKSSSARKEKSSVMGMLRSKFEELAEKADLSPSSRRTRIHEKHPKPMVLFVSLGPPEQARIYMELELMITHTANAFLMTQFSHGRMAMDSIKKTVDSWRAKGRPTVLEFMYDQATQRDLIAANQQNLRFYGEKAGDGARINATLYGWRQVASFMTLRTFCDADTVIMKLLFDIEQVLNLLGAREPLLLRLQQIRASANENMRIARAKDLGSTGREPTWISQSSNNSPSRAQSVNNSYGGPQSVPESYKG